MKPMAISVEEAGKLLGIGRKLAYQLAREGRIPTIRLGARRLIVPLAALEQMLGQPALHNGKEV